MSKKPLLELPVTASQIQDFLSSESDFGFEMKVLHYLKDLQLQCQFSGWYNDPLTKKLREFDIVAKTKYDKINLSLAVECKNFKNFFPLLVNQLPREEHEAFIEIIVNKNTKSVPCLANVNPYSGQGELRSCRLTGNLSRYKVGNPVGKRTNQVGLLAEGEFRSGDPELFEKLNQVVNCTYHLVEEVVNSQSSDVFNVVIPVIVVPDNTLWGANYNSDGSLINVEPLKHSIVFKNKKWNVGRSVSGSNSFLNYAVSHVELVTFSHLPVFVADLESTLKPLNEYF